MVFENRKVIRIEEFFKKNAYERSTVLVPLLPFRLKNIFIECTFLLSLFQERRLLDGNHPCSAHLITEIWDNGPID